MSIQVDQNSFISDMSLPNTNQAKHQRPLISKIKFILQHIGFDSRPQNAHITPNIETSKWSTV